ncbi:hypothetical protein BKA93DRAFT_830387 [Sparassis latifolia]
MQRVSGKTDPSTLSAVFSLVLPYQPPRNKLAAYVWRKRMLFESTTGLVYLEPWEKLFIFSVALIPSACLLFVFVLALTPMLEMASLYIRASLTSIEWALTYPGLFVRVPDSVPGEMQMWVARNLSRAL